MKHAVLRGLVNTDNEYNLKYKQRLLLHKFKMAAPPMQIFISARFRVLYWQLDLCTKIISLW